MIRRLTMMVAVGVLAGSAAWAQDARVELSGTAGWTFSDGDVGAIDESPVRVDPKDAFSWGARLGFNLTPNVEIGGLFNLQSTDLEASGIINRSIPQKIYNYHGYVAYNFGAYPLPLSNQLLYATDRPDVAVVGLNAAGHRGNVYCHNPHGGGTISVSSRRPVSEIMLCIDKRMSTG